MRISSVTYNTNITKYQTNNQSQQPQVTKPVSFKSARPDGDYGLALIHLYQMDKLKEETKEFPKDIEYRKQLMANAGLNPLNQHKLRAIIGPQETEHIIKEFDNKPEVFSSGENWFNVNNHIMRANLHMHTTSSDGSLTVTELLDKAADYANSVKRENPKIKEPFVVAITDHDTTEGVKEAIKVISEKPMKYANLRVILGTEITTFNNVGLNIVDSPTNVHVLAYGIDPNEKTFKEFIEGTKEKKLNLQNMMVKTANATVKEHFGEENFFSVGEAKHQYNTVSKNIIGIFNGMDAYFDTKIAVDKVILKDKYIVKELKKHNAPTTTNEFMERLSEYHTGKDGNNKIQPPTVTLPEFINKLTGMKEETVLKRLDNEEYKSFRNLLKSNIEEYKTTINPKYDYMPNFATIYQGLKGQPDAILGVAHPIDTTKNIKDEGKKYEFLTDLFKDFKENCKEKAKFTEAYYQSYKTGRKEFNESTATQKFLKTVCKALKLLRTGSYDTHGLNIFMR